MKRVLSPPKLLFLLVLLVPTLIWAEEEGEDSSEPRPATRLPRDAFDQRTQNSHSLRTLRLHDSAFVTSHVDLRVGAGYITENDFTDETGFEYDLDALAATRVFRTGVQFLDRFAIHAELGLAPLAPCPITSFMGPLRRR